MAKKGMLKYNDSRETAYFIYLFIAKDVRQIFDFLTDFRTSLESSQ